MRLDIVGPLPLRGSAAMRTRAFVFDPAASFFARHSCAKIMASDETTRAIATAICGCIQALKNHTPGLQFATNIRSAHFKFRKRREPRNCGVLAGVTDIRNGTPPSQAWPSKVSIASRRWNYADASDASGTGQCAIVDSAQNLRHDQGALGSGNGRMSTCFQVYDSQEMTGANRHKHWSIYPSLSLMIEFSGLRSVKLCKPAQKSGIMQRSIGSMARRPERRPRLHLHDSGVLKQKPILQHTF